jgi:hypothetical protein
MGEGAFILLKSRRTGPESAKQLEIRLANLRKILHIARSEVLKPPPRPERARDSSICGDFRHIWLIVDDHSPCYLNDSFWSTFNAISREKMGKIIQISAPVSIRQTTLQRLDICLSVQLYTYGNDTEYFIL